MPRKWTPITDPPSTAPWIDDIADVPVLSGVIMNLPTWNILIPSNATACRIIPIGIGADDGTLPTLTIHGINIGLSSEEAGAGLTMQNGFVQDICVCSGPVLGTEDVTSGFGQDTTMLLCKSLGTFTVGEYYKGMDRAVGRVYNDGTDDIFTAQQVDNDSYSEIIIGNLAGYTHLSFGLSGVDIEVSGTVTAFNLLVSFRLDE